MYIFNLEQLNGSYVECERVQKLDNYVGHFCEIFDGSFYTVPIKFGLSEKHTKLEKIFLMVLTNQLIYLVNIKTMRKIFLNYVCFSKSPNFRVLPNSIQM